MLLPTLNEPSPVELPSLTVPSLIAVVPPKVLLPLRTSAPAPDLTMATGTPAVPERLDWRISEEMTKSDVVLFCVTSSSLVPKMTVCGDEPEENVGAAERTTVVL